MGREHESKHHHHSAKKEKKQRSETSKATEVDLEAGIPQVSTVDEVANVDAPASNPDQGIEMEIIDAHADELVERQDTEATIVVNNETLADEMKKLDATANGLTSEEATKRLLKYGPNELTEKKQNPVLKFLGYMWNPLSWTMEVAALLSIILVDYVDFILIVALLLVNAALGFWEENSAGNAIAALKGKLAPNAKALRNGEWTTIPAVELVPGDIIRIRYGDVVPADAKMVQGTSVKIDQASLTGESLPASKFIGDNLFSGSIVKAGELQGLVTATGGNTFFGKAARLVAEASQQEGHFQKVLRAIGFFCIGFIAVFVVAQLLVQFVGRHKSCKSVTECYALNNVLVIIVGGIPIAMPVVMSVTMAIGAGQLAKKQAIVSRLTAVEELAGMDTLCSDKTGTLTLNQLTLDTAMTYTGATSDDVIFDAALASHAEDNDAIDIAIINQCHARDELKNYQCLHFTPFNPTDKKTVAKIQGPDGRVFWTSKGAPQVILNTAANRDEIRAQVEADITELAGRGYRALGVSRADAEGVFVMSGVIPLFDPPREDTALTIKKALALGVSVKMITGDQLPIAKETARRLGMNDALYSVHEMEHANELYNVSAPQLIERADGFAEVFPEHKFDIVKELQKRKHIVGMTGDGVNDAPALKQANIGIAVADATDAARAASDIVLLSPGLFVIIDAIIGARRIFQRMKNYAIYSIASTIRIVLVFSILTIAWDFYWPTIIMVILAIVNDGTVLTISKDNVAPSSRPDKWILTEIFLMATVLASWLVASTIVMFAVAKHTEFFTHDIGLKKLGDDELRGFIYIQVAMSAQALIFVTRAKGWIWQGPRPGIMLMLAFVVAQTANTFIGVYGFRGYPKDDSGFKGCGWKYAVTAWIWNLVWMFPLPFLKQFVQFFLHGETVVGPLEVIPEPEHEQD